MDIKGNTSLCEKTIPQSRRTGHIIPFTLPQQYSFITTVLTQHGIRVDPEMAGLLLIQVIDHNLVLNIVDHEGRRSG